MPQNLRPQKVAPRQHPRVSQPFSEVAPTFAEKQSQERFLLFFLGGGKCTVQSLVLALSACHGKGTERNDNVMGRKGL